ncbi:unnamed protein product, partial [Effrenium voratum]
MPGALQCWKQPLSGHCAGLPDPQRETAFVRCLGTPASETPQSAAQCGLRPS